jgi:hypothetical protein
MAVSRHKDAHLTPALVQVARERTMRKGAESPLDRREQLHVWIGARKLCCSELIRLNPLTLCSYST